MYSSRKRNKVQLNWSDLHLDLLLLVVKKIDCVEDYFAFRGVCTGWRLAASYDHDFNNTNRELPLLLETNDGSLRFSTPLGAQQPHSISPVANVATTLSEMMNIRHCLGCRGWLLVVQMNGDMNLVHVMSGVRLSLPRHQLSYECEFGGIKKMILSSSPLTNPSNFTLMIVYGLGELAYWRPGNKTFTEVKSNRVVDVIYSSTSGVFYGLSRQDDILLIDENKIEFPTTLAERNMNYIPGLPESPSTWWKLDKFVVESDGDLLLVVQHAGKIKDVIYNEYLGCQRVFAFHFRVYKIEEIGEDCYDDCVLTEMKNLGNRAVFVGGLGASISVKASDIPGCKANHIYYTGHNHEGKVTHAVYNLADGLVDPSGCGIFSEKYNLQIPSLWVTPTFV